MAVKTATIDRSAAPDGAIKVTWSAMANGDTGEPVRLPRHQVKTFQLLGTLSVGGACTYQGSNDDGTTWASLADKQGTTTAKTALGLMSTQDQTVLVRPSITAGDGSTSLTVVLLAQLPA